MLDLADQIARVVDDAVTPVSADEARTRAVPRDRRALRQVLVGAIAVLLVVSAAALWAARTSRRPTQVRVEAPSSTTVTTLPVASGQPIGYIDIKAIGVHWVFVQGTSAADESKGPMHDPESAMPGSDGNVIILGHRTMHGAPFFRLDELKPGAVVTLTTLDGTFHYVVDGSFTVPAAHDDLFPAGVLDRVRDRADSLTLITNTPRFSAHDRLVVTAHIDGS